MLQVNAQQTITDHHALSELLSRARPMGALVVWGEQIGDLDWDDRRPEVVELAKVDDKLLRTVARETFGTEAMSVWFITRVPPWHSRMDSFFEGTRYAYDTTYGCSTLADNRYSPPLYFAVTALLRDMVDPRGGKSGVDQIARALKAVPAVAHSLAPTTWRAERTFRDTFAHSRAGYR
jgi:hypothetical protein